MLDENKSFCYTVISNNYIVQSFRITWHSSIASESKGRPTFPGDFTRQGKSYWMFSKEKKKYIRQIYLLFIRWIEHQVKEEIFIVCSSFFFFRKLERAAWYCRPEFCICLWATLCAAAILAAIIALALIPVYRNKNNTTNNGQQQPQQDSGMNELVFLCRNW